MIGISVLMLFTDRIVGDAEILWNVRLLDPTFYDAKAIIRH